MNRSPEWPVAFSPWRLAGKLCRERQWAHPGEHGPQQAHHLSYGVARDFEGRTLDELRHVDRGWVHDTRERVGWMFETPEAARDEVRRRLADDRRWREVDVNAPAASALARLGRQHRRPPGIVITRPGR